MKPLVTLIFCATVAACATPVADRSRTDEVPITTSEPQVSVVPLGEDQPDPTPSEAEQVWRDPIGAAREYIELAATAFPPQRQDWQLKAAAALIAGGRYREAARILTAIDLEDLPTAYLVRQHLSLARIALHRERPQRALTLLTRFARLEGLDPRHRADLLLVRARARLASGQKLLGLDDLLAREAYLVGDRELALNQRNIWRILGGMNSIELQAARQQSTDDSLNGWLDLALLDLEFGVDRYRFRQVVAQWQQIYPTHPAQAIVTDLLATTTTLADPIRKIALLLPLTSRFGTAARAVRDGFAAMHAATGDPRKPALAIYDVGNEPGLASLYYRLAVDEGADFVVGPLGKEAVTATLANGVIQVPTLLLGTVADDVAMPPQVYEFDLAPEQEARQVAERAYADGHRVAGILYPDNPWGSRIHEAFVNHWLRLGGYLGEAQAYVDESNDFSVPIKQLLNINNSEERKSALANRLGTRIEFQARRRQDLDFLFVASRSRTARLLKPQINFFQGHDLPVYATSHIYDGKPDPVNDADLNRIHFGDMPWLLRDDERMRAFRASIDPAGTYAGGPLARLFALGVDAFAITQALPEMSRSVHGIDGATAILRLAPEGRIERQLCWARFQNGVPVLESGSLRDNDIAGIELDEAAPQTSPPQTR